MSPKNNVITPTSLHVYHIGYGAVCQSKYNTFFMYNGKPAHCYSTWHMISTPAASISPINRNRKLCHLCDNKD